jgi:DNA-binding transcriptional regulator/RsmH inhibitor MraZ
MHATEPLQPMFTAEHPRQLDSGHRVMLPKDWRSLNITEFFLISGSTSSFGIDCKYIRAYPRSEYNEMIGKIKNDPDIDQTERQRQLFEIGSACRRVVVDPSGRLTLPPDLCKESGIGTTKNTPVMLTGEVLAFSIWKPSELAAWKEQCANEAKSGRPRMSAKQKYFGA